MFATYIKFIRYLFCFFFLHFAVIITGCVCVCLLIPKPGEVFFCHQLPESDNDVISS